MKKFAWIILVILLSFSVMAVTERELEDQLKVQSLNIQKFLDDRDQNTIKLIDQKYLEFNNNLHDQARLLSLKLGIVIIASFMISFIGGLSFFFWAKKIFIKMEGHKPPKNETSEIKPSRGRPKKWPENPIKNASIGDYGDE